MKKIPPILIRSMTLIVLLCSRAAHAAIVITGGTWTSNGLGATVTDPDITISGTLVVNTNAAFVNCPNIKMGSGATIEVNDGITLAIDGSHIYSNGNYTWQGIVMDGTATTGGTITTNLTSTKTTIIEDAETAIDGGPTMQVGTNANYNFNLNYIIFNRNTFSAIHKYNTSGYTYPGATMSVKNFLVTCAVDATAATLVPTNLKPSYIAGATYYTKPKYGMIFAYIGTIYLGQSHPGVAPGKFSYLNAGVNCWHCIIEARTCTFENIQMYDPTIADLNDPDQFGIGFNAYYSGASNLTTFSPSSLLYQCVFSSCAIGMRKCLDGSMTADAGTFQAALPRYASAMM